MKHWPTLIIVGTQHHKETWRKWLLFCPPHLNTVIECAAVVDWHQRSCCKRTLWAHAV